MVCSLMVSRVYYIWYQSQSDTTQAYLGSKWIVLTSGMFSFLWVHGIPLGEGEWTLSSKASNDEDQINIVGKERRTLSS